MRLTGRRMRARGRIAGHVALWDILSLMVIAGELEDAERKLLGPSENQHALLFISEPVHESVVAVRPAKRPLLLGQE